MKKGAVSPSDFEEIREISDVIDDRDEDFTWLSTEDVKAVIEEVKRNRESIRDRFLISILYESGARINEVLSLKLKDLKPAGKGEADIHFFGKGNKHREHQCLKKSGNSMGSIVKDIIRTKNRRLCYSILTVMDEKTKCQGTMPAGSWRIVKRP